MPAVPPRPSRRKPARRDHPGQGAGTGPTIGRGDASGRRSQVTRGRATQSVMRGNPEATTTGTADQAWRAGPGGSAGILLLDPGLLERDAVLHAIDQAVRELAHADRAARLDDVAGQVARRVRQAGPVQRHQPADAGPAEQRVEQREGQLVVTAATVGDDRRQKVERNRDNCPGNLKQDLHGTSPSVLQCDKSTAVRRIVALFRIPCRQLIVAFTAMIPTRHSIRRQFEMFVAPSRNPAYHKLHGPSEAGQALRCTSGAIAVRAGTIDNEYRIDWKMR
ncbi:hypothetical protein BGLA2_450017 [Burkholderia gladioli]|nr:hypothetical protein BGLA2_450017 [Burkholderia gladioli]